MKRLGLAACLALAVAALAAPAAMAGDVEEATAAYQKAIDLFNARDYPAYLANIHDNFEGFIGVQTPLLLEGKAAWVDFIKGVGVQSKMAQYKERIETVRAFGNTVVINGYHDYTIHTMDGKAVTANGRTTSVLIKQDGKWLVASAHYSSYF